jgi:hypothetical protein
MTNPFTGKKVIAVAAGPLASEERKAVQDVLAEYSYKPAVVQLPDGKQLEVDLDDDFTGGMIILRHATPDAFSFLFKFADAGSYVLCPTMEGNPSIVTTLEASKSALASRLLEPEASVHVAEDAHSIAEIIYPAFGEWDAYRARVINELED